MKKILFILFVPFSLLLSETINIIPPTLANMNNYNNKTIDKQKPTNNLIKKKTTIITKKNNNTKKTTDINIISNKVPIINNNKVPALNIINNNSSSSSIKYKNIVSNNIIDSNTKIDYCSLNLSYIYKKLENKGYILGLKNSKWEFQQWLLKMKPYLDNIFLIKSYYIEGILEPPMIDFKNNNEILNNGKTYIKREGEYQIKRKARFKIPLKWEDFLLTDHLEKPNYNISISYYLNNKSCPIDNNKLKESFLKGYKNAKDEIKIIYEARLKKLSDYMKKLNRYQYLYLTRKIRPPVITPLITPIKNDNNNTKLIISQEQYTIVKPAEFNPILKDWKPILVENKRFLTYNKRIIIK